VLFVELTESVAHLFSRACSDYRRSVFLFYFVFVVSEMEGNALADFAPNQLNSRFVGRFKSVVLLHISLLQSGLPEFLKLIFEDGQRDLSVLSSKILVSPSLRAWAVHFELQLISLYQSQYMAPINILIYNRGRSPKISMIRPNPRIHRFHVDSTIWFFE
jgi:hypothetical protein